VKAAEAAELIVISGAGLEEFMEDLLLGKAVIDASQGVALLCPEEESDHHDHGHEGHHHESDPHIWLSPEFARAMVHNISNGLSDRYPDYIDTFAKNEALLLDRLQELEAYGKDTLSSLSCRELITFHDGFSYFCQAFDLTILEAVEEESGSEASAKELIHLIEEVEHHQLPAIFVEANGSVSAADIIARETGARVFSLDMAMAGDSYFDAMYHNINTIKEALE
jgi:ABC-type Zn uptake system ZnuABC Zn-binding protein ZnuA